MTIIISLLSGCSEQKKSLSLQAISDFTSSIFSTRPIDNTKSIVVFKLDSPALFENINIENGKKTIDKELETLIVEEQNQLIEKIKSLAPEAQILYRYKYVLNAIVILANTTDLKKISETTQLPMIKPQKFSRPQSTLAKNLVIGDLSQRNSVKFIGSDYAQSLGIKGQNMQVGIIDTGIDYTHAMLGGTGLSETYNSIDSSKPTTHFPNAKVVGGIDLVGKSYDAASENFNLRIPVPDDNPLDEGGHGSHVAGTVAGIGDNLNSYSGVAPEAKLHAIKVFGADGSTSDEVVIAGLEYAAENNLDVVNLSLGSQYGEPHILYAQAIKNLVKGGTIVVASAGNSGQEDFIVGAPSVSTDAISVAASIDDAEQNWKFRASELSSSLHPSILVESIEAQFTTPIDEAGDIQGELFYVGLADVDFDQSTKEKLKGKVAFIDRGKVSFAEKITRAESAGAVGVVVANNQPGDAIPMGGDTPVKIPAIMITKDVADQVKADLSSTSVVIKFKTDKFIEKKENIDTITSFSSKGPRPIDGFLKPEITAPGENIISAAMGGGAKGVPMSGTSMSGPHIAGVMALLKQAYPQLTVNELKSLVMGTTKTMFLPNGKIYPLSTQGTGRVQIEQALNAKVIADYSALSLGIVNIENKKSLVKKVQFKNITDKPMNLSLVWQGHPAISIAGQSLNLSAKEERILSIIVSIDANKIDDTSKEIDGYLFVKEEQEEIYRLPVLAVIKKISRVQANELLVHAQSVSDQVDALTELKLVNLSQNKGTALLFNLIDLDQRKFDPKNDPFKSHDCDLQAAGYRLQNQMLQIAIKIYSPLTNWQTCEVSVLIDANNNKQADQELVGIIGELLPGVDKPDFVSVLLDAIKAVSIRKQFETDFAAGRTIQVNYKEAILDVSDFKKTDMGNVAIVQTPLQLLQKSPDGTLNIKIATTHDTQDDIESDDFLNSKKKEWRKIDISNKGAAYLDLPNEITLEAKQNTLVQFTKGAGKEKLLVLYPENQTLQATVTKDEGMQILSPKFIGI